MTRISAKDLVDDFIDEKFNGKVRDRSQGAGSGKVLAKGLTMKTVLYLRQK